VTSRRIGIALAAVVLGAGALTAASWLWRRAQPEPNVGVARVDQLAAPARPSPASKIPTQAATLPSPATAGHPVRVRIDRLHISAPVIPVGVDSAGNVVIPASVRTVGWYRYGPALGDPGSMVLAGHVDSAQQGNGAFARLRELEPGDRIEVTGTDGRTTAFHVVGREEYPKATIRLDRYFGTTGPSRLTLITCGGRFDRNTGHYRDNVVITAE
jgi:hypothetical protein